jgi:hypothetical protein
MSNASLDTLSRLQDIRLRVFNRERISPAEMRTLLLDIMRDRENAAHAGAKARTAAKKAAGSATAATAAPVQLDINALFGPQT